MGLLVEGKWVDQWYDTQKTGGTFQRKAPSFRHHLGAEGPYRAASGRYHLYVAGACPWAHRTMIFRALKGLESHISVTPVDPLMVENGWEFADTEPLHDAAFLHQIYTRARSDYTGRVTVPVLWDKQTHQIVNNESSEIIRMFNGEFESLSSNDLDFWPADLRESIEVVNERVYSGINNGVYKAGFATSQEAYDKAVVALFDTLDWVERLLSKQPYLVGDTLTEADWRLFTTLLRFDLVYVTHFKCDRKRIVDYPNLWAYTRQLLSVPGVAETFDIPAIREHYFRSHASINPHQIISIGPSIDWSAAHDRDPNPLESVRRHPQES